MKKTILIPLPHHDFDPTEVAVPWKTLTEAGLRVVFATPSGKAGAGDPILLSGNRFGPLKKAFMTDENGLAAYRKMEKSSEFRKPQSYGDMAERDFDGLLLPGGHAPGVREYIESSAVQTMARDFFTRDKPVAAICHGVLILARTKYADTGQSILYGKKTTALPLPMEGLAYNITRWWMGSYYKTYALSVETEVKNALRSPRDFYRGPFLLARDTPLRRERGFYVKDGNYLSARWPGDAHQFAFQFLQMVS